MNHNPHMLRITVFGIGFFSLLAQALLFREFLTVFDGNELSTGLFFFSWLFWMGFGALLTGRPKIMAYAVKYYEFLPLLFPLFFLVQKYLLLHARELCQTAEYAQLSLSALLIALFFFNAPVSIFNGFMFVGGVAWLKREKVPVALFYIVDAGGSFAGALTVTLLLYCRVAAESIFLIAAVFLCFSCALHMFSRSGRGYVMSGVVGLILLSLLFGGAGRDWQERDGRVEWQRILNNKGYQGMFVTPQAKYLYGNYRGGFVVMAWGGTVETLPGREAAVSAAAVNLAECPHARQILVIGAGMLEFCRVLNAEPQVKKIVWITPDPDYGRALVQVVPPEYREVMGKVEIVAADIRDYLHVYGKGAFDLAVMELSAPSSLVMNRYYSLSGFQHIRDSLKANGVFSVGFPGGENYMGNELALLGSSLLNTLETVFPSVILQPGTHSRFFAGKKSLLCNDPVELQTRLSAFSLSREFPPEGFFTLFDPFRNDFQMKRYQKLATKDKGALLNRDNTPVMFLYSIMFSLKKMGVALAMPSALPSRPAIIGGLVAVLTILCTLFLFWGRSIRRKCGAAYVPAGEIIYYVFVSSVVAMGLNLLLIFDFQISHGAIFLYFGLVNACFMLGITVGAEVVDRVGNVIGWGARMFFLLGMLLLLFISLAQSALAVNMPVLVYGLCFFGAGFVSGTWLPVAAHQLKIQKRSDGFSAVILEFLDTLGGAMGGLLMALLCLPLLGINGAFTLLALLAASCIFLAGLVGWTRPLNLIKRVDDSRGQ